MHAITDTANTTPINYAGGTSITTALQTLQFEIVSTAISSAAVTINCPILATVDDFAFGIASPALLTRIQQLGSSQ